MSVIRFISRIFVGLVFIFSGFVKIIDPLGSTYKFIDYFTAFGTNFLDPTALPLAILLSAAEFGLGVMLLFNIKTKWASWGALLLMLVFTPLTLWLAISNAVPDCGCFGDAIILTNWETFYKNLVILFFVLLVFFGRKKYETFKSQLLENSLFIAIAVISIAYGVFNLYRLPLFDFRPYKVGTDIQEAMKIPEGAPKDEYETIFWYEKDGKVEEFTMENYPWQDTTWKFVDSKSILVKKGYEPPIHDLSMIAVEPPADSSGVPVGDDILAQVLEDEGYNFWLVSHSLEKADTEALEAANPLAEFCVSNGHGFYGLTATTLDGIQKVSEQINPPYHFYSADKITLKTIIRSNPGYVLIKDGVIVGKWHYTEAPTVEEFQQDFLSNQN